MLWTLLSSYTWSLVLLIGFSLLPGAFASTPQIPFPDMPFSTFSDFVESNFSPDITLCTVLTLLFSLTANTDLLNLHARQQHPVVAGEIRQRVGGWMKAFVWTLQRRLGTATTTLFNSSDDFHILSGDAQVTLLGHKMDKLATKLKLNPYAQNGQFCGWLAPVSNTKILPIRTLCPVSIECEMMTCSPRAVLLSVRDRDIPRVTLYQGAKIYHDVAVLSGRCSACQVCMFVFLIITTDN
jgi:hypothetical protein